MNEDLPNNRQLPQKGDEKQPKKLDRRMLFGYTGGIAGAFVLGDMCARGEGSSRVDGKESGAQVSEAHEIGLNDFEWLEADIDTLQKAMAEGRLDAVSLTRAYLDRIECIDRQGPMLRSVIETNPEALEIAADLDKERTDCKVRGPLHGLPILIKDNIGSADRMTTTAGSLALEGSVPLRDSFVASQLRRAGAVLLGKTNLSEWANIRSTRSSSGWSARGGQCKNPYVLDRSPCGSSAGSGSATSANLCVAAIGTETNGSIVCPSSANGLVGIKPTLGLVSRAGIVPIAHSFDTAGPMARTVRDAAQIFTALVGNDPLDKVTRAADRNSHNYVDFLDREGLHGKRIGIVRNFAGFDERVDKLLDQAVAVMEENGAVAMDVEFVNRRALGKSSYTVMGCELKTDLALYLEGLGPDAPMKSLGDVIEFNEAHSNREMAYFQQEIFHLAEATGGVDDPEYAGALEESQRLAGKEGIDRIMDEGSLDALIAPTGGPSWVIDLVNGDHFSGGSSSPAAIAGYPNITVPMGAIHGLPVGLSFFGRAFSEPTLLEAAFGFEQATGHRKAPGFVASVMDQSEVG